MANSFFKFKQFTVQQEKAAMKVTTDACLFGAWAASVLKGKKIKHILDVGCGTGLLSLMLAQKIPAVWIDAVEIDTNAALQAEENFRNSLWKNQLSVHLNSIHEFNSKYGYEVIISNPPFFENSLKSLNTERNKALHNTDFNLDMFIHSLNNWLYPDGYFLVLLPYERAKELIKKMSALGYHLHECVSLKQTPHHSFFRAMMMFNKTAIKLSRKSEIIIKEDTNEYSSAFKQLLKDYYLYL